MNDDQNYSDQNGPETGASDSLHYSRLDRLRQQLRRADLAALIISHDDEHLSERLPPGRERLAFISGFTGSAGAAVVLADEYAIGKLRDKTAETDDGPAALAAPAALFTDGRYTAQARIQTDPKLFDVFHSGRVKISAWLAAVLGPGSNVGVDARCVSYSAFRKTAAELKSRGLNLTPTAANLVDEIWTDRPDPGRLPARIFDDRRNGNPSIEKRTMIARLLKERGADVTVIAGSESVNWLLNVRGRDVPGLPVVNSFAAVYSCEEVEWYVDLRKIPEEKISDFQHHFGHVTYMEESSLKDLFARLAKNKYTVYIDDRSTNAWIISSLIDAGVPVIFGPDLCELPKARKNPAELRGMKRCHHRDAVAVCRFLAWFDHLTEGLISGDIKPKAEEIVRSHNEATLSEQLFRFRSEQDGFIENSFDTISALGPDAAIIHYNHATLNRPRGLGRDPLYLVDSGGQYDDGTTDITRTVLAGPGLTEDMKTTFTLVLKGMIALHRVKFPRGTFGGALDSLARAPLWQHGLNYDHGTGHGVGHCLNVHEGPQSISWRAGQTPLEEGMVTSIEPGCYVENEYGVRCENLCVVENVQDSQIHADMLAFIPLTYVPFDIRLIRKDLLTDGERNWINDYHLKVREIVREHLSDMEINWLLKATAAI